MRLMKNYNNGCSQKCPCRLWVNCPYYIDMERQNTRLRMKNNQIIISQWYSDHFRENTYMPDICLNG